MKQIKNHREIKQNRVIRRYIYIDVVLNKIENSKLKKKLKILYRQSN